LVKKEGSLDVEVTAQESIGASLRIRGELTKGTNEKFKCLREGRGWEKQ